MSARRPIVLASASPRRRDLLERAGLIFEVRPTDVDESLEAACGDQEAATLLAERKARAGAAAWRGGPAWIIGADTVVALHPPQAAQELLGKPEDAAQARDMLSRLSGSRHAVVSAVCVLDTASGAVWVAAERTWVTMRPLAPEEIEGYVTSGEWRDKAGGYAIQESADAFVTALEGGGFDTVVGLPVPLTLRLLAEAGAPLPATSPE